MKHLQLLFFITLLTLHVSAQNLNFNTDTLVDLNGDTKLESIRLESVANDLSVFKLKIDRQELIVKFSEGSVDFNGLTIVDINASDKYKEIAIHWPGASSDHEFLIYGYKGNEIIQMNHIFGYLTFKTNGIVYCDNWEGFWMSRDKYVLDNETRRLILVPQFGYSVAAKLNVKNNFPIFREKELRNQVALLSKDSEIEIILCHDKNVEFYNRLFLIKSKSGLLGWARFQEIYDNSEGFMWAD